MFIKAIFAGLFNAVLFGNAMFGSTLVSFTNRSCTGGNTNISYFALKTSADLPARNLELILEYGIYRPIGLQLMHSNKSITLINIKLTHDILKLTISFLGIYNL